MNSSNSQNTISTPNIAKMLGISRQRVNELGRLGKIPREADGRWNPERVRVALEQNLDQRRRRPRQGPQSYGFGGTIDGPVQLFEAIRHALHRVPDVLLRTDRAVPLWVVLTSVEALDMLVGELVLGIDEEVITDDSLALPKPDFRAILSEHGITPSKQEWKTAEERKEAFLNAMDEALRAAREDYSS